MGLVISKHAREQMARRNINCETMLKVVLQPDQIISDSENTRTVIYQSLVEENNRMFLYRVFVDMDKSPNVVVTLYKTTKIAKYYEGKV